MKKRGLLRCSWVLRSLIPRGLPRGSSFFTLAFSILMLFALNSGILSK
jgi:hypothetical protein